MQTEDDTVYREKSLNNYMKSYKDSLKEEEVLEKERKDEQLKGAKVVTGKTDAPSELGLGTLPDLEDIKIKPDITTVDENVDKLPIDTSSKIVASDVTINNTVDDNLDLEIKKITDDKDRLINDLEESKEYMKSLDEKMSTINEMFSLLKSK